MPACAGMTDRRNYACRKSVKIADNESNLPFQAITLSHRREKAADALATAREEKGSSAMPE
jgi:hypothetical protein